MHRFLVVVFGATLLAACQSGGQAVRDDEVPLNFSQARKLVDSLESPGHRAPPRSIEVLLHRLGPVRSAAQNCDPSAAFVEPKPAQGWDAAIAMNREWIGDDWMAIAANEFLRGDYRSALRFAGAAFELAATGDELVAQHQGQTYDCPYCKKGAEHEVSRRGSLAVRLDFERANRLLMLARYLAMVGEFENAENRIDEASSLGEDARARMNGHFIESDWLDIHVALAKASVAHATGRYRDAEAFYLEATAPSALLPKNVRKATVSSDLAAVLAAQGRLSEAEATVREALFEHFEYDVESAYNLQRLAEVLNAQGRYRDAQLLLERVVNIYEANCAPIGSVSFGLARQRLARSLARQGNWSAALAMYAQLERDVGVQDPEQFERLFRDDVDWGWALIGDEQTDRAVAHLRRAREIRIARFGEDSALTAEASGLLAVALLRQGSTVQARSIIEEVLPILIREQRRRSSSDRFTSASDERLRAILEAYLALLTMDAVGSPGRTLTTDPARAFEVAQLAASGEVQRALAAASARAKTTDSQLAELARSAQDAEYAIEALRHRLVYLTSADSDSDSLSAIARLRARVRRLEVAQDVLEQRIIDEFPDYGDLTQAVSLSADETRSTLEPDEALLFFYTSADQTYIWTIAADGRNAFSTAPIGRKEMTRRVSALRVALDPSAETLGDIPAFDLVEAHALYDALLAPVQATWQDAKHLVVVSPGPLGQLPLGLLPTTPGNFDARVRPRFAGYRSVRWLARTHTVSTAPSVAAKAMLQRGAIANRVRRPLIAFADPVFSTQVTSASAVRSRGAGKLVRRSRPTTRGASSATLADLPALPETSEEVREIATALSADPATSLYLGVRASEAQLKRAPLKDARVIVFATHGLVQGDLDGLHQPALALSAPEIVGGDDDGLLTLSEILELDLNADWVVLSACNTAAADGKGAEVVSGLGRAFFYAGARALLASNWPVETTSAKALTTGIFQRQSASPNLARAQALQETMLWMIDQGGHTDNQGRQIFSYAHPIFWAPFSLVGDGGGEAVAAQ